MEIMETVTAQDTARSLWIIYRQMPDDAQKVFKEMIGNDDEDAGRMRIAGEVLRDDWEAP